MGQQLVKAGIWLPRYQELEETYPIAPEQIRYAPRDATGAVDRAAWEAQRGEDLGASDLPTLMGTEYGSRQSPCSLYWTKKGKYKKVFKDTSALERGHEAEYHADVKFIKTTTNLKLTDPFSAGIRWAIEPRFVASIDRVLFLDIDPESNCQLFHDFDDILRTKQWIPVEVKSIGEFMESEWGTSFIPDNYYDQVQGQLMATGKPCALVLAMYAKEGTDVTTKKSEMYTVYADPVRMSKARIVIPEFIERLDMEDPPEPDGTDASTECIKELTRKADVQVVTGPKGGVKKVGKTIPASPEMIRNVEELFHAQETEKDAKDEAAKRENLIRLEMGEATKCSHLLFTVNYSEITKSEPYLDEEAAQKNEGYLAAVAAVKEANEKLKAAAEALKAAAAPFVRENTTKTRRLLVSRTKT